MNKNLPIIEKRFEYRGYPCVVIFHTLGHRCGYVGLPRSNRYFGCDYEEIDIDCHGGLTYATDELYEQSDVDRWWIGFDCAHCDDAKDYDSLRKYYTDKQSREMIDFWENLDHRYPIESQVRDLDYVTKECELIVDQLYVREEEDEDAKQEPPMIFGEILIPIDDWEMAKEALKEEIICDDSRANEILNRIFRIALENAEEDKT